jgi:hypothetical protein
MRLKSLRRVSRFLAMEAEMGGWQREAESPINGSLLARGLAVMSCGGRKTHFLADFRNTDW